jgi:hypothetical protein
MTDEHKSLVEQEIKGLREALAAIVAVPSRETLLLNAEARAMYEYAKRALESESVLA